MKFSPNKSAARIAWELLSVYLLMIFLAILMTSCSSGEKIVTTTGVDPVAGANIEVPAFTWRIRDEKTLTSQWEAAGKVKQFETDEVKGFAGIDQDTGRPVVYTTPPKHVDDDVTKTLGHEVMHVVLGSYHKELSAQ